MHHGSTDAAATNCALNSLKIAVRQHRVLVYGEQTAGRLGSRHHSKKIRTPKMMPVPTTVRRLQNPYLAAIAGFGHGAKSCAANVVAAFALYKEIVAGGNHPHERGCVPNIVGIHRKWLVASPQWVGRYTVQVAQRSW